MILQAGTGNTGNGSVIIAAAEGDAIGDAVFDAVSEDHASEEVLLRVSLVGGVVGCVLLKEDADNFASSVVWTAWLLSWDARERSESRTWNIMPYTTSGRSQPRRMIRSSDGTTPSCSAIASRDGILLSAEDRMILNSSAAAAAGCIFSACSSPLCRRDAAHCAVHTSRSIGRGSKKLILFRARTLPGGQLVIVLHAHCQWMRIARLLPPLACLMCGILFVLISSCKRDKKRARRTKRVQGISGAYRYDTIDSIVHTALHDSS